MKRIIIYMVSFAVSAGLFPAAAQEAEPVPAADESAGAVSEASGASSWDRANTAYINGDFRTAAAIYEQSLAQGFVSAKLYYNLANACFKENRLGKAILYYHRALRLAPGSDDIRYNLSVAEARTKDN
ncbi:MAG: tetratricopeptide repeat protein, partial [Alistipes sp.]|nr:tetratricopeptide repeat protein [Alistipes sp.]